MGTGRISSEDGKWETHGAFIARKLDEDGTGDYFETDQAKTDTVTLTLAGTGANVWPARFREGIIRRVQYRLNPTAAETYTLRIWRRGGVADDYASNMELLYESATARVDDTDYDVNDLQIPFRLYTQSTIYYSIDWTGAPGNTPGFIVVSGEYF